MSLESGRRCPRAPLSLVIDPSFGSVFIPVCRKVEVPDIITTVGLFEFLIDLLRENWSAPLKRTRPTTYVKSQGIVRDEKSEGRPAPVVRHGVISDALIHSNWREEFVLIPKKGSQLSTWSGEREVGKRRKGVALPMLCRISPFRIA